MLQIILHEIIRRVFKIKIKIEIIFRFWKKGNNDINQFQNQQIETVTCVSPIVWVASTIQADVTDQTCDRCDCSQRRC